MANPKEFNSANDVAKIQDAIAHLEAFHKKVTERAAGGVKNYSSPEQFARAVYDYKKFPSFIERHKNFLELKKSGEFDLHKDKIANFPKFTGQPMSDDHRNYLNSLKELLNKYPSESLPGPAFTELTNPQLKVNSADLVLKEARELKDRY